MVEWNIYSMNNTKKAICIYAASSFRGNGNQAGKMHFLCILMSNGVKISNLNLQVMIPSATYKLISRRSLNPYYFDIFTSKYLHYNLFNNLVLWANCEHMNHDAPCKFYSKIVSTIEPKLWFNKCQSNKFCQSNISHLSQLFNLLFPQASTFFPFGFIARKMRAGNARLHSFQFAQLILRIKPKWILKQQWNW